MKDKILQLIDNADTSNPAWIQTIIYECQDNYARGFLSGYRMMMTLQLMPPDAETARKSLRFVASSDIWGKDKPETSELIQRINDLEFDLMVKNEEIEGMICQ